MSKGLEQLQELMNDISKWSDKTFNNQGSIPKSYHLQKESKELTYSLLKCKENPSIDNIMDVKEELADCMILLIDCSTHFGCNADELITACWNKMEINKKRKWGQADENGVFEHIKTENDE